MPLFSGVSVDLRGGDILQVVGPNGIGKTTLIKMLASVLAPTGGELLWGGRKVSRATFDYLSELIFIGHLSGISATLTPRENLAWWLKVQGIRHDNLDEVFLGIDLAGLADRPCYTLSAGQWRRAALARLLACDCRVWLLDEPFTAIDRQGSELLTQLMVKHAEEGGMVIFSSHQDAAIGGALRLDLQDFRSGVAD